MLDFNVLFARLCIIETYSFCYYESKLLRVYFKQSHTFIISPNHERYFEKIQNVILKQLCRLWSFWGFALNIKGYICIYAQCRTFLDSMYHNLASVSDFLRQLKRKFNVLLIGTYGVTFLLWLNDTKHQFVELCFFLINKIPLLQF